MDKSPRVLILRKLCGIFKMLRSKMTIPSTIRCSTSRNGHSCAWARLRSSGSSESLFLVLAALPDR